MLQSQADLNHDHIARDFRAAVLGSDHILAARLAEQYAAAVRLQWALMSQAERASSGLPKQATELLTWAQNATKQQYDIAAMQSSTIEKANRHLNARAVYLRSAALDA